jgi:hypothetical protein
VGEFNRPPVRFLGFLGFLGLFRETGRAALAMSSSLSPGGGRGSGCAEHVRQLGSESLLFNLMEVKN